MSEERGFRETGKPGDKHVIIDDLTSYDEEKGLAKDVRKRSSVSFGWLKNIFVALLLVGIVVGSFWISFLIGKRVLTPVKPLRSEKVTPIKEPDTALVVEEIVIEEEPIAPKPRPQPEPMPTPEPSTKSTEVKEPVPAVPSVTRYYKVRVGSFTASAAAADTEKKLKAAGYPTYVKKVSAGKWSIQVGAFAKKSQADSLVGQLKKKGFESTVVYE